MTQIDDIRNIELMIWGSVCHKCSKFGDCEWVSPCHKVGYKAEAIYNNVNRSKDRRRTSLRE